MIHQANEISDDIVIISQALHHIEKSILIRDKLFSNAEILNFNAKKNKLLELKKSFNQDFIRHFQSLDQLDFNSFLKVKAFIFFSFSPTLPLITFIKKIKDSGKKIIFFQDNHQFSIHKGFVNSIILRPDLVVAASKTEKRYLLDNLNFSQQDIISCGWFFQKELTNYLQKQNIHASQTILIAFSAPPNITPFSDETDVAREAIINWAQNAFPEHMLLIKLHPHEDMKRFNYFMSDKKVNFSLLPSQSSIVDAISKGSIIICSNESQLALDVISTNIEKRLIFYSYQKDNFLVNQGKALGSISCSENFEINFHELGSIEKENIRSEYLQLHKDAVSIIRNEISQKIKETTTNYSQLDLLLWQAVYGKKTEIINFLETNNSEKYRNLSRLIFNKNFDMESIYKDFGDQRTRDPLCIILIRHFLKTKNISKSQVDLLTNNFYSEYIIQFFFRDFIRFNNLINAKLSSKTLGVKYLHLIKKIENLYANKNRIFGAFFFILNKLYALNFKPLSSLLFFISNSILKLK